MVLSIERIYNISVNRQKFIHLFLVAVLCIGQFAASTHIVGHMHDHHRAGDLSFASTDSTAQATLARLFEIRQGLGHSTDNEDKEEAVDCSIYHTFSGLCGTFTSPKSVVVDWSQLGAIFFKNENYIARATADDQRIRAPPTLT